MQGLTVLLDNNVWIYLYNEAIDGDFSCYGVLSFLSENEILKICYTTSNLIEIAQTNDIAQLFSIFGAISNLSNLHYYDQESNSILPSSKNEFIQRAFYKLFEFGNEEILNELKRQMIESRQFLNMSTDYFSIKDESLDKLQDIFKFINFESLREILGISKGQFNHLSPEKVEDIIRNKYIQYYEKNKNDPEAASLPTDIFNKDFFERTRGQVIGETTFKMMKLLILEIFGYKQKKLKKVKVLNSLIDSIYVATSENFQLFVSEDKELVDKINKLKNNCRAVSYTKFKDLCLEICANYKK